MAENLRSSILIQRKQSNLKYFSKRLPLKPSIINLTLKKMCRDRMIAHSNQKCTKGSKILSAPHRVQTNTGKQQYTSFKAHKWFNDARSKLANNRRATMTRRSRPLDLHGLSKIHNDGLHPLPEKPEETVSPWQVQAFCEPFDTSRSDSYHSNKSDDADSDKISLSTSSSRTTVDLTNTFLCDGFSSRTAGNTSTSRSSVFSWGNDDEFDKKAGVQVRRMFDEINTCLFENEKLSSELHDECGDWKETFPYLRLVGKQIIPEAEDGTEFICTEQRQQNNKFLLENAGEEYSESSLAVSGSRMEASEVPKNEMRGTYCHFEEEIFAIDGDVEEFIAFDNNASVSDVCDAKKSHHRNRPAMPPITPHNFAHDSALSECFDHVWSQIVKTLTDLLKLYIQVRAKKEMNKEDEHSIFNEITERYLESSLELPATVDTLVTNLNETKNKPSSSLTTASDLDGLKELMTIRSVSLKQRPPFVTSNIIREEELRSIQEQSRPGSSTTIGTHRQFPRSTTFRAAEQQFYDRMSAKGPKRSIRLQPLQQPKTPGQEANVGGVRGTRMTMTGDRSLSPPFSVTSTQQNWGQRNGALPPLDRMGTADTSISFKEHRLRSPKRNTSAVSNQAKHSSQRDRTMNNTVLNNNMHSDSRPNTSQSSRTSLSHHTFATQSKSLHALSIKPVHTYAHTSNEYSEHVTLTSSMKTLPEDDLTHQFDRFVLWGHGPPLISAQQRRGRAMNGGNAR